MISVIIPAFNIEGYIGKCIQSILSQSYSDFQVLIIDDGSDDKTAKIIDMLAECDNRIISIHKYNSGVSGSRNYGLKMSEGEWISFIDGDDYIKEDMFELLLKNANQYDAEISHCGYERVNENGDVLKLVSGSKKVLVQKPADAIMYFFHGICFVGSLWNKLYHKSVIGNTFFNEKLANNEDILFNFQVFQNANRIVFCDETKYCYTERATSACNTMYEEKRIRDMLRAYYLMEMACPENKLKYTVREAIYLEQLSLYRYLILKSNSNSKERLEAKLLKKQLKNGKNQFVRSRKDRINYFFLIHFKPVYRYLYFVYDLIRKPNWDVVEG